MSKTTAGFGLVEALLSTALLLAVLLGTVGGFVAASRLSNRSVSLVQANTLLSEGAEALRLLRDQSFSELEDLELGREYALSFSGSSWQIVDPPVTFDQFDRRLVLSAVYRGASGDIVESPGTLDENSRQAVVLVSWNSQGETITRSLALYLTRLFED
jgi:hypothetical protein